ncbi:hypothetical protein [Bradyrhizobium sp. SZCCHNS3053]|uniref:hypothetical protein n=1 Tax=Bradyrhizobium sp. SZCCHNS3053 TaxID=3057322 RepID=UPI002916EDED|nr:hypothetical protein [Bradyrhizobium sp. SZCCHNS3053]
MFLTREDAVFFRTDDLIDELKSRGWKVLPQTLGQTAISFNRIEPFPAGVDFKVEATDRIRSQLSAEHLEFRTRPGFNFVNGKVVTATIHSALLRVFR